MDCVMASKTMLLLIILYCFALALVFNLLLQIFFSLKLVNVKVKVYRHLIQFGHLLIPTLTTLKGKHYLPSSSCLKEWLVLLSLTGESVCYPFHPQSTYSFATHYVPGLCVTMPLYCMLHRGPEKMTLNSNVHRSSITL